MISQAKVDEVRRLLAEGRHSQRRIAALAEVSRGTVAAIASGKRLDREPRVKSDWDEPSGPIVRCPSCGGRVYSPCQLCRVRDLKRVERHERRQSAGGFVPAADPFRCDGRVRNRADSPRRR